jgi:hypothetical protein
MVLLAVPMAIDVLRPDQMYGLFASVAFVLAISLPFLLLSKKVFSLPRSTLNWVFAVHVGRSIGSSILIALIWHFALGTGAVETWFVLLAARLVVSRLPLPNKELMFAGIAVALVGEGQSLGNVIAFTAALTLTFHILLIAVFSIALAVTWIGGRIKARNQMPSRWVPAPRSLVHSIADR